MLLSSNPGRFEEISNESHAFRRPTILQPVAGAGDYRHSNIGRHMAHDHRCYRTKRLLSPNGQYGHRQLHLLEDLIVFGVLRKRGELSKPSPHPTWLRVCGRIEGSGSLVGLGGIASEIIPYPTPVTTARMSFACVFSSYPPSGFDDFPIPRRSGTTTV